jgi:hypothetical protein
MFKKLPPLLVPLEQQALRFARLFVMALVPQLLAVNGHLDRTVVIALIPGAAEAAYKELKAQWDAKKEAEQEPTPADNPVDAGGDAAP